MKFKFKILFFLFLVSSFVVGQNAQLKSLSELRQELSYYNNVIKAKNMWFLTTTQLGMDGKVTYSTELLPRKDAIRKFINNLKAYGTFNKNTIYDDVEQVYRNSEKMKSYIKDTVIPQLKYDIANYAGNPNIMNDSTSNNNNINNNANTCPSFYNKQFIYRTGTNKDRVRWSCQYDTSTHRITSEQQYVDGKKHGKSIGYYRNGNTHTIFNWWKGHRVGEQVTIGENGKRRCIKFDSNGNTIKGPNVDFYGFYDC